MNGELLAKKIMETVSDVQKVYFTANSVYPVFNDDPTLGKCGDEALNIANDNNLLIVPIKRYTSEEDEICGKAGCVTRGVERDLRVTKQ